MADHSVRLTTGSISRGVWFLAWPVVIQSLLQVFIGTVDLKMVGYLGPEAIAAVGIGRQIILIIMILILAVSTGATAVVARLCGAGDREGAGKVAAQALILCLFFAIVMTPIGLISAEGMLFLLGAEQEVIGLGLDYMRVFFLGVIFFLGNFMINTVIQGAGDTRTPLLIQIVANIVNIVANYLFIFGVGIFPNLGVMGAAVGSVLSRFTGMSIGLYVLFSGRYALTIRLRYFSSLMTQQLKRILQIGFPAALQGLSRNISTIVLLGMVARTPGSTAAVSAFSIGMKISQYSLMPGLAVGAAATTLVGMNLGARNASRAEESGWVATGIGALVMGLFAFLAFLFAPQIVTFFVRDEAVLTIGTQFIRIIALAEPFHAVGIVLSKGLQGAGDTKPPFYITVFCWIAVRIPLAYFLAFVMGYDSMGVWWAISLTVILQGILVALRFREGQWKSIKVVEGTCT